MAKRFKFPDPDNRTPNEPAVFCPVSRILSLYNEANGKEAARLSASVQAWFIAATQDAGWAGCVFLKDVQTGHGAGFLIVGASDSRRCEGH